jgi:succinoglycan biosynthesis transport protein ExoP
VIWTEPPPTCVPAVGGEQPLGNTHEILTSARPMQFFNKLRSQYEYVIIDLSPLAPIADARTQLKVHRFHILVVEGAAPG